MCLARALHTGPWENLQNSRTTQARRASSPSLCGLTGREAGGVHGQEAAGSTAARSKHCSSTQLAALLPRRLHGCCHRIVGYRISGRAPVPGWRQSQEMSPQAIRRRVRNHRHTQKPRRLLHRVYRWHVLVSGLPWKNFSRAPGPLAEGGSRAWAQPA